MQCRGFDPPLRKSFLVEGIFPLEITWVLTPFPQNCFRWEYKLRSSLHKCILSHGLKSSRHSCPRQVNTSEKNHTQDAPSTKMKCDYLYGWTRKKTKTKQKKNGHMRKNLNQNAEPQRYSWGMQKKKKKKTEPLAIQASAFQQATEAVTKLHSTDRMDRSIQTQHMHI